MNNERGIFDVLRNISKRDIPMDFGVPSIANSEPVPISKDNFHHIGKEKRKLCFVDGGNNSLFLTPGQAIHMVRLYYSLFNGDRKEEFGRFTFILDSKYQPEEKKYKVKIYDVDHGDIFPEEMDVEESSLGEEKIKGIGDYIRRMGEWLLMEKIADKCDFVVHDGSLQTGEKEEYVYQERVFSKVHGIIGLSKTCSLLTTRGFSLVAAIHHLAEKNGIKAPWYYNPVAKNISTIRGDMYVVKLHSLSDYAFRTEIYPHDLAEEVLAALVPISNDPTFIGYPYGLLEADINARISDEEIKLYKAMVYDYLDPYSRLEQNALNAHDIISEVK